MITAESLLLAEADTMFGLLAGSMNLVGLVFPFPFSYAGILPAIAVGLGFGITGLINPPPAATP